jgi:hypothetical protein
VCSGHAPPSLSMQTTQCPLHGHLAHVRRFAAFRALRRGSSCQHGLARGDTATSAAIGAGAAASRCGRLGRRCSASISALASKHLVLAGLELVTKPHGCFVGRPSAMAQAQLICGLQQVGRRAQCLSPTLHGCFKGLRHQVPTCPTYNAGSSSRADLYHHANVPQPPGGLLQSCVASHQITNLCLVSRSESCMRLYAGGNPTSFFAAAQGSRSRCCFRKLWSWHT